MFGFGRVPTTAAAEVLSPTRRVRVASPWSPGLSTSVLAADWFGAQNLPATREEAMRVPAVAGARNLICESLAGGVLRAYQNETPLARQPKWLTRTDSDMPPQRRLAWTFDDLFFSGFSLWATDRASNGQIGDAMRVPPERWDFDDELQVLVDDEAVTAREVILFTGRDEGLLITGSDTIRQALDLAAAVGQRVRTPVPTTLLIEQIEGGRSDGTDPDDVVVDDEGNEVPRNEVRDLLNGYANARRDPVTGTIVYVPYGIKPEAFGQADISLYEQGRNASVLDVARLVGIPASLLDASGVAASLTYESTQANRVILNDRLRGWAGLVDSRLSMDDVTAPGTRISLDLSYLTGPDTGLAPASED